MNNRINQRDNMGNGGSTCEPQSIVHVPSQLWHAARTLAVEYIRFISTAFPIFYEQRGYLASVPYSMLVDASIVSVRTQLLISYLHHRLSLMSTPCTESQADLYAARERTSPISSPTVLRTLLSPRRFTLSLELY
jgi:hypothetical protein